MREYPTLIGQRFGMLVVVAQAPSTEKGQRRWLCQCDCGKQTTVLGSNLKRGMTTSCGCKKTKDLTGQHIGKLTVLGRSERYGARGARQTRLWECRCDCGAITYKATDTLTNPAVSMCRQCAAKYATEKARAKAGFVDGTQLTKLMIGTEQADNLSGVRGVYYNAKTGKYTARIKFQGRSYYLGSFYSLEEAAKARQTEEEKLFAPLLEAYK